MKFRGIPPAGPMDAVFRKPYWNPPAMLGHQFFAWGNGGPSGDLNVKAATIIPWPTMDCGWAPVAFAGELAPSYFFTKFNGYAQTPQGVPCSVPVNPFNNAVSDPVSMAVIQGLMKGGTPAQLGGQ